eukprot:1192729-Prorocentrum_minimum.AAC.2
MEESPGCDAQLEQLYVLEVVIEEHHLLSVIMANVRSAASLFNPGGEDAGPCEALANGAHWRRARPPGLNREAAERKHIEKLVNENSRVCKLITVPEKEFDFLAPDHWTGGASLSITKATRHVGR